MNIWIITTGSSDVQLSIDKHWNHTHRDIRRDKYNNHDFRPQRPVYAEENDFFQVPARIMGIVYGEYLVNEHYHDLRFPIFDTLSAKLEALGTLPDKIIVLLTDQSNIFDNTDKKSKLCPVWQDTCTLEPIIKEYLRSKFSKSELIFKYLIPKSKESGLDNWDSTIEIVKDSLSDIELDTDSTVFISHQAGTPAISSAIQFVSLAKFGSQAKFLVGNEYDNNTSYVIHSPKYLWAMKLQEAKVLLSRHDYEGVQDILEPYLKTKNPTTKKIRDLLKISIQWNYANFDKFAKDYLQVMGDGEKARLTTWWWSAYEAAYLAEVRRKQGNTVEAFFHSFRAVESLVKEFALSRYKEQIKYSNYCQPKTPYIHEINLPNNLHNWFKKHKSPKYQSVGLFGKALFELLQSSFDEYEWNQNSHIKIFFSKTNEERNSIFHTLGGLQEQEMYKTWGKDITNSEQWQKRVLGCLNFVSKQQINLQNVSLILQVHEELKNALESYQPS